MSRRIGLPRGVWSGALALAVALALAPASAHGQRQQIVDIDRLGDSSDDPSDREAWRIRLTDVLERLAARKGLDLRSGDTIGVRYPWILRVRLELPDRQTGRVALAADAASLSEEVIVGAAGENEEATVSIERAPDGGSRIHLHRGALFLTRWKSDRVACMVAAGACTRNLGTSYALRVDASQRAHLAVTADSVSILWWGRGSSAEPTVVVTAPERSIWTWTLDEPPRRTDQEEGPAGLWRAIEDEVAFAGDDIWGESIFKKPLFWIPVGVVLGGVICIIWCGGDDVTGDVIVNP